MLYEKEGLIRPHRTPTNRRLFSEDDLALIQFIQYLTEIEHVNLNGIRVILQLLERALDKYPTLKKEFFENFEEKELIWEDKVF